MRRFLTSLLFILLPALAGAKPPVYQQNFVNEAALAYSKNYDLDVTGNGIDLLAMQAVYSSATLTAQTFTDGAASTGSITVVSTSGLTAVQGSDTITVATNALPSNALINLNGTPLVRGTHWTVGDASSNTAVNIMNAVNAVAGFTASTTAATVVTVKCASSGTFCNSDTLTVNTSSITLGGATFSGGVNNAFLTVAGVSLTQGTEWTQVGTASGTAKSISDAIMGNASLNSLVSSTWSAAGVVTATATSNGSSTNYSLRSSTPAAISVFAPQMFGGADSAVGNADSHINIAGHKFTTALPLLYTKTAGTSPGTLVSGTTYYAIVVDGSNFKLSTTSTGAVAGSPVVSVSTQTAGGGGSFSLTPLAFTGTWSFKWQSSNDGVNFTDLPNISSVTYSTPGSSVWDGPVYVRYLRLAVTAGTGGGLKLTVTGNGKANTY